MTKSFRSQNLFEYLLSAEIYLIEKWNIIIFSEKYQKQTNNKVPSKILPLYMASS